MGELLIVKSLCNKTRVLPWRVKKVKVNEIKALISEKYLEEQFIKYLIIGFINSGLRLFIFLGLTEYVGMWYILSNTISEIVSLCTSFIINNYWVFKSQDSTITKKKTIAYSTLYIFNYTVSSIILFLLTDIIEFNYILSKVLVMAIIPLYNFVLIKKFVYI